MFLFLYEASSRTSKSEVEKIVPSKNHIFESLVKQIAKLSEN